MQKSLSRNLIYNILYAGINTLFPFLVSIYVSRVLLPEGVGKVAYAQNIASYFLQFATLGLGAYGVRELAKIREVASQRNKLFTELFLLNVVSTTLALIGYFALVYFNRGFKGEWILFFACGLEIFFNYNSLEWIYRGMEEYGHITARLFLTKVFAFLCLLLFVKSKRDYAFYALIASLAVGVNNMFSIAYARKLVKFTFIEINIKKHIKPVCLVAAIMFLSGLYVKIDTTMLGIITTDDSVGFYTYAQKTIKITIVMADAVTVSLLPRLSFNYDNDRKAFYKLLDKGFQAICLIAIPLCMGLFVVSAQAVEFLYGEAFAPAAQTVQLMCPLALIKVFGDLLCYQLVYSTRSEKILIPSSLSAVIINVIINAILIPRFQQNGAVIASIASELTMNLIQFIYIKKKIKLHLNIKPLFQSFVATGIMTVCVIAVGKLNMSNAAGLFVKVACGAVTYIIVNFLLKNTLMIEAIHIIKNKLTRKRNNA